MSWKTPTTVLLKPDKTFDSFGYIAENLYIELADEDKHRDWYYFKRFKMLLHNKSVCYIKISIEYFQSCFIL